ncbi:hypothetical protein [Nesterenkonia populi]|uniref:hypothetical protein n=1 Tax=Nesterenkonia populi TaxID=1591087 RepID=UPI0011BF6348|nr:hypothetical protein [Nesterenkonia populi]
MRTPTLENLLNWAADAGEPLETALRDSAHVHVEDRLNSLHDKVKSAIHKHRELAYEESALLLEEAAALVTECRDISAELCQDQRRQAHAEGELQEVCS